MAFPTSPAMDEEAGANSVELMPTKGQIEGVTHGEEFDWDNELGAIGNLVFTKLNFFLIFVPLGLYAMAAKLSSIYVFTFNFLAILPLASVLSGSTESLAHHVGQLFGGLLNATFGNAVEMIMCVQAVRAGLIRVVQGNLLGSVLSNLLLVLGMAVFAAGIKRKQANFNPQGASANMTCLVVASIAVALPTLYRGVAGAEEEEVLMLSHICSAFLAILYFMFLYFQLYTHSRLFEAGDGAEGEGSVTPAEEPAPAEPAEEREPVMSAAGATCFLAISTLIVAACSEGLVDSINEVSLEYGLPKAFIGVILLPIVGNAAEHATAVMAAYRGKMDLALGVAVGSSTQIALFVVPVSVLTGWCYGTKMSLSFRNFDMACQLLSVFLVCQVLQHGKTNWLHGAMLMCTYVLIGTICWFIPE